MTPTQQPAKMNTCYALSLARHVMAVADLVAPHELTPGWTITRINVPEGYRGHGYGSQLLRIVLQDADEKGLPLYLEPQGSGPLGYDELVAWYERYGFTKWRYGYLRRPKPTQPQE